MATNEIKTDLIVAEQVSVNGDAGSAGEVLTSQGAGLPPIWSPGVSAGGAYFRKSNDPASASYAAGVSVIAGGTYAPAAGYTCIFPSFWTLPAAVASGGGAGPPINPGIRFTWSDSSTTIRYNTSTAATLTEQASTIDFNKDGLKIVGVAFVVNNTSGGSASADFTAWLVNGSQF